MPNRSDRRPSRPGGPRKFNPKRKFCRFCADKSEFIDYKDIRMLKSFVTEKGKMLARRMTGTCTPHQRELTAAIKRARSIALLSYTEK